MVITAKKVIVLFFPIFALFAGMFALLKFQNYQPEKLFRDEGIVAGTETEKFDLKYPRSEIISESYLVGNTSLTFKTTDTTDTVLKYYEKTLTAQGWKKVGTAIYKKNYETITLTLTKGVDNSTIVNVDYYSAVPTK